MAEFKKCMIIGASPLKDGSVFKEFNPSDFYVICADGGYDTALKYGITPDYIVGDFDSISESANTDNIQTKVLPSQKDLTDTMYATLLGLKLELKYFVFVGCSGGERHDHTIANYNVMLHAVKKGAVAIMADDISKSFLLYDSKLTITDQKDCMVSVFPFFSSSCNVTYKGLKYPMYNGDLQSGDVLMGISNEIISNVAQIQVHAGYALIIVYNNKL